MPNVRISSSLMSTRIVEQFNLPTILFVMDRSSGDSDIGIMSDILDIDLSNLRKESYIIEMKEEIFAYLILMTRRTRATAYGTSRYLTIPK